MSIFRLHSILGSHGRPLALAFSIVTSAALVLGLPLFVATPAALAGTGGLATCADGSLEQPGQLCGNIGFSLCPAGGASVLGAPCPFNPAPSAPSQSSSGPVVPTQQVCAIGIVISVTQSCPPPAQNEMSPTFIVGAGSGGLDTAGQYCSVSGGGSIWVPAGADPASMGC